MNVFLIDAAVLLVQAVSDRRCRGLVDDEQPIEPADVARILGGLALGIVEVSMHGDHSVRDLSAQICLGRLLHLRKDHGRDLLCMELLVLALPMDLDHRLVANPRRHLEGEVLHVFLHGGVREHAPDETLRVEDCVLGVTSDLVLRGVTDEAFRVRESHIRRGRAVALVVGDDFHTIVLPHADA